MTTALPGPTDEELPSYSRVEAGLAHSSTQNRSHTEFSCSLSGSDGQGWMTLFVQSRAPNKQILPIFHEGDPIIGRVELSHPKRITVKGVSISVKGTTTRVGQEEQVFLDLSQDLFPPAGVKGTKKLDGKHSWNFTFELPRAVELAVNIKDDTFIICRNNNDIPPKSQTFRLPPNFSEKASAVYVDYRITVTLKRGMFQADNVLTTGFSYLPITQPVLPSVLRQEAYSDPDSSDLIGPDGDPDGWQVLPVITQSGLLFDKDEVKLSIELSIATPLMYTAGSPIPLHLKLNSSSTVLLDLIRSSAPPKVYLVSTLAVKAEASLDSTINRSSSVFKEPVAYAYFWPVQESNTDNTQIFKGEINTTKNLKPSFLFPGPSIRYTIEMLPFEAPGLTPLPKVPFPKTLVVQPTEIVSGSNGIRYKSRTQHAGYTFELPSAADYSRSAGYLENGNQRFVHYHGFF